PEVFPDLARRLEETHHQIMAFTQKMLSDRNAHLSEAGEILKTITAFRADVAVLSTESTAGRNRAAAARCAIAALVRQVAATRIIGAVLRECNHDRDDLINAVTRELNQATTKDGAKSRQIGHYSDANSPAFVVGWEAHVLLGQSRRALSSF